ncbi:hypothetical protein HY479_03255 [Candidatus Uhrbacteria bacterium]|nr:hypothetical protein [Candidatus Uhrbacteria bacterium]
MADSPNARHRDIITALASRAAEPLPENAAIAVNEAISRFAFLYERIRNAVDYKDDHLIRKAAILRIMKRQLLLESDPAVIADRLVRELIGARYLPNATLPESVVGEVADRIRKYQAAARIKAGSERHLEWVRGLIAVEIEEVLVDARTEKALMAFLYERLADRVVVKGAALDDTERNLQTYVACLRTFQKADDEVLGYKLLRAFLPEWMRPEEWINEPRPIAERLVAQERRITACLKHPLSWQFLRVVKPWAVSLNVLWDVLKEKPEEAAALLEKPDALGGRLARKAEEQYASARGRVRRGTVRAIIYLFITKMLVALLLEVPLEWLWYGEVNRLALVTNLIFPPILMFFVGLLIRIPGQANTERLKTGVVELLSDTPLPVREIRARQPHRGMRRFWFTLAYACTFLLSFGVTIGFLRALHFTWLSIAMFLFFLCVVSFFGFRLRVAARELVVVEGKQGFFAMLVGFFSLPILRAGKWLSRSINRINVFLFIFDFLFEAPFKIFLTVLEEWFAFLKEKKEEL